MRIPSTNGTTITADPEVEALLGALPDLGLFRVLALAPTVFAPWLGLGAALLTGLQLDPQLRELAILQVAVTTGCAYEQAQHEDIAAGVGVPRERVVEVLEGRVADPVLLAVGELVRTGALTAAACTAVLDRLGTRQTVELLQVVSYYRGAALVIAAVDLAPDPGVGMVVVDLAAGGRP